MVKTELKLGSRRFAGRKPPKEIANFLRTQIGRRYSGKPARLAREIDASESSVSLLLKNGPQGESPTPTMLAVCKKIRIDPDSAMRCELVVVGEQLTKDDIDSMPLTGLAEMLEGSRHEKDIRAYFRALLYSDR